MVMNNLGTAQGEIVIKVDSLQDAQTAIRQFSTSVMASFEQAAQALAPFQKMSTNAVRAFIAEQRRMAQESADASRRHVADVNAAARVEVQASKERIAAMRQVRREIAESADDARGAANALNELGQAYNYFLDRQAQARKQQSLEPSAPPNFGVDIAGGLGQFAARLEAQRNAAESRLRAEHEINAAIEAREAREREELKQQAALVEQEQARLDVLQAFTAETEGQVSAFKERASVVNSSLQRELELLQEMLNVDEQRFAVQTRIINAIRNREDAEMTALRRAAQGLPNAFDNQTAGGRRLGDRPTTPAFVQFGVFPAAGLAQQFGASGVANALYGVGNVVGAVDAINPFIEGMGRVAGRFRDMGGVLGSLARQAVDAKGNVTSVAASFATVGLAAAPIVIAIGGLALVLGELQRRFEEARDKAREYLNAQVDINTLVLQGGTTEDVQERIDSARVNRQAREDQIAEYQSFLDEYEQIRTTLPEGESALSLLLSGGDTRMTDLNRRLQDATGSDNIEVLPGLIEDLRKQVDSYSATIEAGQRILESGATAGNDFAESLRKIDEALDMRNQARVEAQLRASSMSAEDLQKALQGVQNEIAIYEGALDGASEEQAQAFRQHIDQLNEHARAYREALPSAQFRDAVKNLAEVNKQITELGRANALEVLRTMQDRALSGARELQDFLISRGRALTDFYRQQQERDEDYLEDRAEAEEDFQEETQQREQSFQDRLRRIWEQARISILEAASRLDARAVFEQQRRRDMEMREQQEDRDKERDERLKAFEEQRADQEAQYQKQRQRQQQEFNLRLQREDQDRSLRLQRQYEDYRLQDQRRQEDFNARIQQLIAHNNVMQSITEVGLSTLRFTWNYFLGALNNDTQSLLSSQQYNGVSGVGSSGFGARPTPYATGTPRLLADGVVYAHADEAILNAPAARALRAALGDNFTMPDAQAFFAGGGRGGDTMHFNGNIVLGDVGGRSDEHVVRLVEQGMRSFFNQYTARRGMAA